VRRDPHDHVIVLNEQRLQRLLAEFATYDHDDRTHLGRGKGTPSLHERVSKPNDNAGVVAHPRIGGLHHRDAWREAA